MAASSKKCVMVLDQELPVGLAANTAGVLAFTLGREIGEVVGHPVADGSGSWHLGITRLPIPVLGAGEEGVRDVRLRAKAEELLVVDFTDAAQTSKTYEEYEGKISAAPSEGLRYLGVALYGGRKLVDGLTGSLSLLR